MVRDHASHNGSFVNGVPVGTRRLVNGDRIELGRCVLLFHDEEAEIPVDEKNPDQDHSKTQSLSRTLAFGSVREMLRDFDAVVRTAAAIEAIDDPEVLQTEFLRAAVEVTAAEEGQLIEIGEGNTCSAVMHFASNGHCSQFQPSWVDECIRKSAPTIDRHAGRENRTRLCVPFDQGGAVSTVLVLISKPDQAFDPDQMRLATALLALTGTALDPCRRLKALRDQNRQLVAETRIKHDLIGQSAAIQNVLKFIARVAPASSTVLIRGESGTGKELVARALHANSSRSEGPFIALNCAAIAESLLESELFGYEKGAFTGAMRETRGKLEAADGGTLFLDEIGELAPALQSKLLRVLQDRAFQRVGGTRPIRIDVRLVLATNRDLEGAIRSGSFREDLFYRINVITLQMPPLRERKEDIGLLASYFLAKFSAACGREVRGIADTARRALVAYEWPGNVRELENAIERAVVLGHSADLRVEDLPEAVLESAGSSAIGTYHESVNAYKKKVIVDALERGGSYGGAARLLGIHPNNLHRLIRTFGLKHEIGDKKRRSSSHP